MGKLPSIGLVRIKDGETFNVQINKTYIDREGKHRSNGFRDLLEKFQDKVHESSERHSASDLILFCFQLPDMDIAVNSKAEGRVLVPWEHVQYSNLSSGMYSLFYVLCIHCEVYTGSEADMVGEFSATWLGDSSVWEAFRRTCPPGTPARQLYSSFRNPNVQKTNTFMSQSQGSDDPLTFAETVDDDYDFCEHPWAHYTQGHFFSDWRTVPVLYPVFSPSKPKGFADIRIPSHYYSKGSLRYTYGWDDVSKVVKEIDDMEVPWDKKSDRIFWRGATTGGGSTPPGFAPTYQRHRYLTSSAY